MRSYLLGIDVGTSGVKTVLIDGLGRVKASALAEYPLYTPYPLWAQQDPDDWWRAAKKSLLSVMKKGGVKPEEIASIGLTGQMHGLVLLDKKGKVLRPCIMWNDQRSASECAKINDLIGEKKIIELTGNPILAGFTAPKIMWVKNNEPAAYNRIAKILLPKDYIRFKLTGKFISDVSDASGTSLFDVAKRRWSQEMLKYLNIAQEWLPDVMESAEISGYVSSSAASETYLKEGITIIAGAGDQAAQAVGSGIISNGSCSVTIGTSGVVFTACDRYKPDPNGRLHAFCHAVPDMWHLMGVMLSAGGSFKWFKNCFSQNETYDSLTKLAGKVPSGSEGLIFLPYLSGERAPYPDPLARGAFIGLTTRHTKAHLARAVMEGVAFGIRDSLVIMKKLIGSVSEIRISGGGAKSRLWRKITADVLGQDVFITNDTEGAAYGAALLAGVESGIFKSIDEACRKSVKVKDKVRASSDMSIYEKYYDCYQSLYPALKNKFSALSGLGVKRR